MIKLPARLTGALLLVGSYGTTLVHREIWKSAHHGPAQAIKFCISLLTFVLASAGVLLLIHGSKLFVRTGPGPLHASAPGTAFTSRLIHRHAGSRMRKRTGNCRRLTSLAISCS